MHCWPRQRLLAADVSRVMTGGLRSVHDPVHETFHRGAIRYVEREVVSPEASDRPKFIVAAAASETAEGVVYNDLKENGLRDADEPGVAGVATSYVLRVHGSGQRRAAPAVRLPALPDAEKK